jgi:hypothetical protein
MRALSPYLSGPFRAVTAAAVVVGAFGLTLAVPAPAVAQLPACDPNRPPELSLDAPNRLAYGRAADVAADDLGEGSYPWNADTSTMRATLTSTDPARPLTYGYSDQAPAVLFPTWPLRFAHGDPSATFTLVYREYEYAPYYDGRAECQRTLQARIEAIDGIYPRVTVESFRSVLDFDLARPLNCPVRAAGEVRVVVTGGGTRRSVVLNDQCGHFTTRGGGDSRWELRGRTPYGLRVARFKELRRRDGQWTYRYRVSFRGRTIRAGRFRVKVRYTPGYRIWEGTDAFVNVCINDLRRIWSSGGRLYCDEPPFVTRSIRMLKR